MIWICIDPDGLDRRHDHHQPPYCSGFRQPSSLYPYCFLIVSLSRPFLYYHPLLLSLSITPCFSLFLSVSLCVCVCLSLSLPHPHLTQSPKCLPFLMLIHYEFIILCDSFYSLCFICKLFPFYKYIYTHGGNLPFNSH